MSKPDRLGMNLNSDEEQGETIGVLLVEFPSMVGKEYKSVQHICILR